MTKPTKKQPPPTEADMVALLAWCVAFVAEYARALESDGRCHPDLYPSLKGMQLELDRMLHHLDQKGVSRPRTKHLPAPLPMVP